MGLGGLIPLILPYFHRVRGEVHHVPRYERYPALLGVGVADASRPNAEALFKKVVERNAINMQAPTFMACTIHSADRNREEILSSALREVMS